MCDVRRREAQRALSARETVLRADRAYVGLLEAQSTWAMRYRFGMTQPCCELAPVHGLNAPKGVVAGRIDALNRMRPVSQRALERAAHVRLQTELYGTAPYMALGGGTRFHADTETALRVGNRVTHENSRLLAETDFDRFQFVTIPAELRNLPVDTRLGAATRVGPQIVQPRA